MEFKNNIGLIEVYLNGIERYISLVEQMLIENGAEDGLYEIKFEEHGHGVKTKVNYVSKKIGPIQKGNIKQSYGRNKKKAQSTWK